MSDFDSSGDDDEIEGVLDEMFSRANPNPSRRECPPASVLFELAHRLRDLNDPAWEHLAGCSPCYIEMRGEHGDTL